MNDRINIIVNEIPNADVFCDVGCDHGYASYYMLCREKCNKVIFTDISKKCLDKAVILLNDYIKKGRAFPLVTDGLKGVKDVDTVLVAGMGGEEIIKILKNSEKSPKTLVLQPMKNTDKVRKYLIENGYKIDRDFTFFSDKKYYDLIVACVGKDLNYTKLELKFGRDNLREKPKDFIDFINSEIKKYSVLLDGKNYSEDGVKPIKKKIEELKKVLGK